MVFRALAPNSELPSLITSLLATTSLSSSLPQMLRPPKKQLRILSIQLLREIFTLVTESRLSSSIAMVYMSSARQSEEIDKDNFKVNMYVHYIHLYLK